jgi:hypothetical protein
LETTGLSLQESIDILENAEVKLGAVRGEIGDKIYRKFQAVLKKNPGYSTFMTVCKILDTEDTDPPEDISPGKFHLLNLHRDLVRYRKDFFPPIKEFCLTGGYP